jgi:hypothetical protein
MATFDFTLDETSIGSALDPVDGFLVSLSQTAPSTDRAEPQWSQSLGRWKTGYCTLKGERDTQALYSCRPGVWTPQWAGNVRVLISNASFPYAGRLIVQCIPKGSTWSVTLSDVPNVRAPARTPGWAPNGAFGSYPDWRHGVGPGP